MGLKGVIEIEELRCKGCGLCVSVCPSGSIKLSETKLTPQGYHPAEAVGDKCNGCGTCALICPDAVITVRRYKVSSDSEKKSV